MKIFIIISIAMLLLVLPNKTSSRILYNCPPPRAEQQPINFYVDNSRPDEEDHTTKILLIAVSFIGTIVADGFACHCAYKRRRCGEKQCDDWECEMGAVTSRSDKETKSYVMVSYQNI
ncbi:hypothetical protein Tco_1212821 [Tanacetum coccineum]